MSTVWCPACGHDWQDDSPLDSEELRELMCDLMAAAALAELPPGSVEKHERDRALDDARRWLEAT